MAALPESNGASLVTLVDQAFAASVDLTPRPHLGASIIGRSCDRQIWYSFRWCITENKFDGRMLRLFARGQREEETFAHLLSLAGVEVHTHDAEGNQFRFSEADSGHHFAGSIDGMALGIPDAPATWHVLEFKTHSDKSFQKLCKDGVAKAKPEHMAQMQIYMRWTGLDRALYMAVNKNDDSLYFERVAFNSNMAQTLVDRALRIIESNEPPAGMTDDPAYWECKFCEFHGICHGKSLPSVNCRTCLHSTPLTGAEHSQAWHCAKWGCEVPLEETRKAQPCHRYLPQFIKFAAPIDATDDGDVIYELIDGSRNTFANGQEQPAYTSEELRAVNPLHIGDDVVNTLKKSSTVDALAWPDDEEITF